MPYKKKVHIRGCDIGMLDPGPLCHIYYKVTFIFTKEPSLVTCRYCMQSRDKLSGK